MFVSFDDHDEVTEAIKIIPSKLVAKTISAILGNESLF